MTASNQTYQLQAENFATESENRIHSDEIAKKYGFTGALVPGVTVYGYLTIPLVQRFGADWLVGTTTDLKLLKPTYDGERVLIELEDDDSGLVASSYDSEGTLQALLRSKNELPPTEDLSLLDGPIKHPKRVEIAWDTVVEGQAFAPWEVDFTPERNATYTAQAKDENPIYEEVVHPHFLLALANTTLTNEYFMPAWIHVGSETRHRALLKVGDSITIRTVTLDKWRKKGHEFIRIYVTFWRGDELATDILHTAIFRVAE